MYPSLTQEVVRLAASPRNQRVSLRWPIRYRPAGEPQWLFGETINISGTGLLFLCEAPLELHTQVEVEVVLRAKARPAGSELRLRLIYRGRVIRRVLANWPDLRPTAAIRISHCEIVPDAVRRVA